MVGGRLRKHGPQFACPWFVRRVVSAAGVLVCQLDTAQRRATGRRNTRRVKCDDHLRGRFASRVRFGFSPGGAHPGGYLASKLPSQPSSVFLGRGSSYLECSLSLPKCFSIIRGVLRRICSVRRGTAVA